MKKRTIFNSFMFLLILFLGYVLFTQIEEPIDFQLTKEEREKKVIDQLIKIKRAQEVYRDITGHYAGSFAQLVDSIQTGRYTIVTVFGDPDDPNNNVITYDTSYVPALDSVMKMNPPLDLSPTLGIVPFTDNLEFDIFADTMTYQQALVDVVEVGVAYEAFMGEYADARFKKYDERYSPKNRIKFGDKTKPILTGSWE